MMSAKERAERHCAGTWRYHWQRVRDVEREIQAGMNDALEAAALKLEAVEHLSDQRVIAQAKASAELVRALKTEVAKP